MLRRAGRVLTVVGIVAALFFVYEFVLTGLPHDRAQVTLLAAFRQKLPTTTLDAPGYARPEDSAVVLLDIPSIGVDQVVVEGTSPVDLQSGPGHLRTTPMPGEHGNAVIAGRRSTYGAPFHNLDRLRAGDLIHATTGQGDFVYVVRSESRVAVGQRDPVTGTTDNRLTLITSDPMYLPTGRIAVVATLRGKPIDLPKRVRTLAAPVDLGLSGDSAGAWLALLWISLLLATVLIALRLRRRWPPSVILMLATPVVVGLGVLTFSSLDRMLPGTL